MNEQDVILIERYLANELNEQETRNLEDRLNQDTSFKDLFDWMNAIKQALLAERGKEVSEILKTIAEEFELESNTSSAKVAQASKVEANGGPRLMRMALAIAAAITLLLIVTPIVMKSIPGGQGMAFIDKYMNANPEKALDLGVHQSIERPDGFDVFGQELDSIPTDDITNVGKHEFEIIIIKDSKYTHAYLLDKETLYLFGDFDPDIELYHYEKDGILTFVIKDGFQRYSFRENQSKKIKPLMINK